VLYHSEDGWDCHSPNFSRGDRILALQWGENLRYLGDFSGASWRIDEAGNVLHGRNATITIDGKTPATVAEILSDFHIATPDAATAPPPNNTPTAVGWLFLLAAVGLVIYNERRRNAS
jgi:hypothetical protein